MKKTRPLAKRRLWVLCIPILFAAIILANAGCSSDKAPSSLTVNLRANPMGIDSHPHFSWDSKVEAQTAYQIQVALSEDDLKNGNYVWDSGKVSSGKDLQVTYGGPVMKSATRYWWRVSTWDAAGESAGWSKPSWWETGLLNASDWSDAQWIGGRQPQDYDWTDMTATVNFRITDPAVGMTFFFHAEPVGKSWDEAYVWQIKSVAGNTALYEAANAGARTLYVKSTDNFKVGDEVNIGNEPAPLKIASVGKSATVSTLAAAVQAGATSITTSNAGALAAGDILTIGTGDGQETVRIASMPSAGGGMMMGFPMRSRTVTINLAGALTKNHAEGAAISNPGTGLTFTAPLKNSHQADAAVKAIGKVQFVQQTKHYAGNTGVPEPDPGEPAVIYGVNYMDPQSPTNPMAVGNRLLNIADASVMELGGITADNITTQDHQLRVQVEGNTITTWINGVEVDKRTLSGDRLRKNGSIGFGQTVGSATRAAGGQGAVIRNVRVEPGANPVAGGSRANFFTDFAGGANPFEAGYVRWTGVDGDPETDGLVVTKMPMLPMANPAPRLRKEFAVSSSPIESARLYIAGGSYPQVSINGDLLTVDGEKPDKDGMNVPRLMPDDGQSESFILYNTYDVTKFLNAGKQNVIAADLGRAWTGIIVPNEWYWNMIPTNGPPRTIAKLIITHKDGTVETIVTDGSWKATDGPTYFDSIFSGDKYDARVAKQQQGWNTAGFDDSSWQAATVMNPMGSYFGTGKLHGFVPPTGPLPEGFIASDLKAMENEPIMVREIMKPSEILETYPGSQVYIFKFAQMHTGFPRLQLKNITSDKAGLTLRIRGDNIVTGEGTAAAPYVLSNSSNFLESDLQVDYYTLSDETTQVWKPSFHYNGQGGVEVYGLHNVLGRAPTLADDILVAEVASSDFPRNKVSTSNELLNAIARMCEWTMLNNAHAHPTDTPSREKNGWTGDGWADAEAWMIQFDVSQFYRLWVRDMAHGQATSGEINVVMPAPKAYGYEGTPGWANANGPVPAWDHAFFEIPWDLYRYYGDVSFLAEVYDSQARFMDYYATKFKQENGYVYRNIPGGGLAEYAAGVGAGGSNDQANINHQLYYRMADYMSKVGDILGRTSDAAKYRALADDLLRSFIAQYWDEATHTFQRGYQGNLQTEQILAVAFGMVPGSDLPAGDPAYLAVTQPQAANIKSCVDWVANSIKGNGDRLGIGIYGMHFMFPIMNDFGYTDLMYSVLAGLENPAWGNILYQGGTTLQESWGGIAGNHHYHSTALTWYYQGLAGIMPTSPGYESIRIKPYVPTNEANMNLSGDKAPLTSVEASIASARGKVSSAWTNNADFQLNVTVPSNTPAEVWVPAASADAVTAPKGAGFVKYEDGYAVYSVGMGNHKFTAPKVK